MTTLPLGLLPTLLRNHACGVYAAEAAVELLIRHRVWLGRSDFHTHCVTYDPDARTARIDWAAVAEFVETVGCTSSEDRILRFAAELAGETTHGSLPDLLSGLDDENSRLVVDAVRHTLGARPGATVACDCGHRIPAVAYSTHRNSPRHAGPRGACTCGQTAPHDITDACLGPVAGDIDPVEIGNDDEDDTSGGGA